MTEMKFNEDDKQKLIDFLNMIATHAKFNMDTVELVQYFKLLSHMQQRILPKLEANILEIKKVIEPEPNKSKGKK